MPLVLLASLLALLGGAAGTETGTPAQPTPVGIYRSSSNLELTAPGSVTANGLDLVANANETAARIAALEAADAATDAAMSALRAASSAHIAELRREMEALRAEMQGCQCFTRVPTSSTPTAPPSDSQTPAPSESPTAGPIPTPTVAPATPPPTTACVNSSHLFLQSISNGPLVLSAGTYPNTCSVTGILQIYSNPGLTTMENAFPRLTRVQDYQTGNAYMQFQLNDNLVTFGDAFPALVELGANSGNGQSLQIASNAALSTLGTAFASLRRIPGTLYISSNPLLTNFEALRNLECHGGAYANNPATYCQGCPAWLLALPQC